MLFEQHLQYKSVPSETWIVVKGLWMAPCPVFRFQNIMYVVEIFAVISERQPNTRITWFIEQHLEYKSVPSDIWTTVKGLWMAPISIFRFQNIMYVVEIFAVISEGQ